MLSFIDQRQRIIPPKNLGNKDQRQRNLTPINLGNNGKRQRNLLPINLGNDDQRQRYPSPITLGNKYQRQRYVQNPQIISNNQMIISNNSFYRRPENSNQQNNNGNINNLLRVIPSFSDVLNPFRNPYLRNKINILCGASVRLPKTKINNISSLDLEKRRCTICLCYYIIRDNDIILPYIHM